MSRRTTKESKQAKRKAEDGAQEVFSAPQPRPKKAKTDTPAVPATEETKGRSWCREHGWISDAGKTKFKGIPEWFDMEKEIEHSLSCAKNIEPLLFRAAQRARVLAEGITEDSKSLQRKQVQLREQLDILGQDYASYAQADPAFRVPESELSLPLVPTAPFYFYTELGI